MQPVTPATEPVAETADVPPSQAATPQAAPPDASLLMVATVRENFTLLLDLVKSQAEAKKTGIMAQAKVAAIEGYVARGYSFFMVLLCLGAVLYLSTQKVLNGVSAGTLTGTIIGYALSHLRPVANE
jgi:hypothetical protein